MYVNRDSVPSQYHVLQQMPVPPIMETLTWQTKTFISADLSERRDAWIKVPAIVVNYNFVYNRNTVALRNAALNDDLLWLIPYYPHMTLAREENGILKPSFVANYKYGEFAAYIYLRGNLLSYRSIDPTNYDYQDTEPPRWHEMYRAIDNQLEVWIMPCWLAYIDRNINYQDVGRCRDGDKMTLSFRLLSTSEVKQYYELTPPYAFPRETLVSPYTVTRSRHQTMISNKQTIPYVYQPVSQQPANAQTLAVKYYLRYGDDIRDDYEFRGAFNWARGGEVSQDWLDDQSYWRLADDKISIEYQRAFAVASCNLRKVDV